MAKPSKAKAIERLQKVLKEIPDLRKLERDSNEFRKWHRNTRIAVENTFSNEVSKIKDFTQIVYSWSSMGGPIVTGGRPTTDPDHQEAYVRGLERATVVLESMIEEIQDWWEDEGQEPTDPIVQDDRSTSTREIFVIHGRDEETKGTVARFLERLELKPIILHEQLNQGQTIIEKFEQHAQVSFAIALLTPDDVGALQEEVENLQSRPRQNVIFEFGYFIGRLGRKKVCALTRGKVEIPSDYDGVIYISMDDAEGWKMDLIRELKGAGMDVDANHAF